MPEVVHILQLPGNIGSLINAFARLGRVCVPIDSPADIGTVDRLVIPGQGRFDEAIRVIDEMKWRASLLARLHADKPTLGICLGMQILFESSDEGPGKGLGFFPGLITRLDSEHGPVPHIGWLSTLNRASKYHTYYYAHSFAFFYGSAEAHSEVVQMAMRKSEAFAASVRKGHVWGCQFHPEKSQKDGEAYLKDWLGMPA